MDEFRNALARRIAKFIGDRTQAWRGCRARNCVAPNIHCSNAAPNTSTPEQKDEALARVHREIRGRLAWHEAEQTEAARGTKR
jgi:hypothetical protein